jgi:hypothetical protein
MTDRADPGVPERMILDVLREVEPLDGHAQLAAWVTQASTE